MKNTPKHNTCIFYGFSIIKCLEVKWILNNVLLNIIKLMFKFL